ncbi:hypothetical protein, partial [Anaerovibrio sp.]|uniref:hypothetical protein n=1 Tax=Anaerovibrio sp. TaxID=1872532 RepID=UPI00388FF5F7
ELAVYGLTAGVIHKQLGRGMLLSLLVAMVCGRIMDIILLMLFGELLQIEAEPVAYVLAGVSSGLAGIVLQLLFIPFIVKRLQQAFFYHDLLK